VSKIYMTAALAAALAASVPAAYAQNATMHEQNATTHETRVTAANEALPHGIQPDEVRASKMIGSAVYDVENRKIGKVADVILNKDGKVDAVVIDIGSFLGLGGKDVAVLPSDIKTDNDRLTLDRTKEQLQQMASYDLENRNTGAGTSASPVEGGRLHDGTSTGR
jgi:sporulation protein YlmC with PRC-barrel domain